MSYIKRGKCEKCGQDFYWSIGHPGGWNEWTLSEDDYSPSQKWWFSFGNLCPNCAPELELPEGEGSGIGIAVMVINE